MALGGKTFTGNSAWQAVAWHGMPEVGSGLGPSLRGQQGDHVAGRGEETRATKERNRDDHQEGKAVWPAVAVIQEGPGHQLWRSSLTMSQMEWETERLGIRWQFQEHSTKYWVLRSREEVRENTE